MNPLAALRERTRQALLTDFGAFCRRAWREIQPEALAWNWHHELVCEHLQLCYEREITRLIITMPPRGMKSKIVSVFFGAWAWAKNPGESFILTSYSDSLSEELNMLRRTLLMSKWFQETFPGAVQFAADQNRREQFKNLAGGVSIATSVEGALTGKGATFLLVDDLLSPQQSYSDLERENANRFFDSTLRSRLNEPDKGVIICISQRLHERDLVGHLSENEPGGWVHLSLPMIAERDEEITFPRSGRVMQRKAGDLLHPVRWPKTWCEQHKRVAGPYVWASQFQQRPAPAGGAIFKDSWFREYETLPTKGRTILVLDTAFSTKKTSDYSAAAVWVLHDGKYYLAWMWRARVEYPQLKTIAEELATFWHPESVLIEDRGSGQSLLQSLKQETTLPVVGFQPVTDKVSRAHGVTGLFESGRVFFPKTAPWLSDFLHELELFPSAAHDDQVDTTTMALAYLRGRSYGGGYGVIDVLKKFDKLGWLDSDKPVPRAPAAPGKPSQARVDGYEASKTANEPCPSCKSTCTFVQGVHLHCRQCGVIDGQDAPKPAGACCGNYLPQIIPGGVRCGNCGTQSGGAAVIGQSRRDYFAGAGSRSSFGRFQ
jgi:predicted phage terminase large subunit-like protein